MVFCLFNKGGYMGFLKIFSGKSPQELERKAEGTASLG